MSDAPPATRGPSVASVTWLAASIAVVVIAQQIASKAVRDGLFLTEFDATALPYAVGAGAAFSFAAALVLGRMMASFSPAVAVPVIFAINGLLFFAEAAFVEHAPAVVAALLYVHTAAFGGGVVSGFWSVINERFDPYTARRVMGRIAGGSTLGGMIGGALTWLFADTPAVTLLVALGIANGVCGLALSRLSPKGSAPSKRGTPAPLLAGFAVLRDHSYPRAIGGLVLLGALMTAVVDYVFKAGVTVDHGDGNLVGFFAMFYTGTGVATFLVQAVGTKRLLRVLGVVPTLIVFPVATAVLILVVLSFGSLGALVALRGTGMVVENSLYRSSYELLYTAVPRVQKRSVKLLIDLGLDRLGTAMGSGTALVVIAIAASAQSFLLVTALVAAGLVLGVLVAVRREYVGSLARQIQTTFASDGAPSSPALPAVTFVEGGENLAWNADLASSPETSATPRDREELLAQVHARIASRADDAPPPKTVSRRSGVSARLLATPLRETLLAAATERGAAWDELVRTAPGAIGQLTDILLSTRENPVARVQAAELLAGVPSRRTVMGLVQALEADEFRVRRAGALALLKVVDRAPHLRPRMRPLRQQASRELRRPARASGSENEFEQASPFRLDARGNVIAPSLELVFLLLAIGGDAEALRLALLAVTSPDATRRGTGLEYLDNLLPGDLRARIVGLAAHPELTQASQRVPPPTIAKLAADFRARRITLKQLQARYRKAMQAQYDEVS